jgi:hypothetical protein
MSGSGNMIPTNPTAIWEHGTNAHWGKHVRTARHGLQAARVGDLLVWTNDVVDVKLISQDNRYPQSRQQ